MPKALMTDYAPIMGPAGTEAISLRSRLGLLMAQGRIEGTDAVPFDPADPVNTPSGIKPSAAPALQAAFASAIQAAKTSGYPLDAQRGDYLYVTRNGERIPLFGGCGSVGYFTIACPERKLDEPDYPSMDKDPNGNSYMQIVSYPDGNVRASTFLTHSLSDDPASPHQADYTRAYAQKAWQRMPFTEAEITASPGYRSVSVSE